MIALWNQSRQQEEKIGRVNGWRSEIMVEKENRRSYLREKWTEGKNGKGSKQWEKERWKFEGSKKENRMNIGKACWNKDTWFQILGFVDGNEGSFKDLHSDTMLERVGETKVSKVHEYSNPPWGPRVQFMLYIVQSLWTTNTKLNNLYYMPLRGYTNNTHI